MVELLVAVVGARGMNNVAVEDDDSIADLKAAIATRLQSSFPPQELTLYHTKRVELCEDVWLAYNDDDAVALRVTPVPDYVKTPYLTDEYMLEPARLVCDYFCELPRETVIHILVCLPEPINAAHSST